MKSSTTTYPKESIYVTIILIWLLLAVNNDTPAIMAQTSEIFMFDQPIDPDGIGASAVALGDLDRDGDIDAYLGLKDGHKNKIYFNEGGTFIDSGQTLGNTDTLNVALGDLDSDGDLDSFVATSSGNSDIIEINNGNGVLQSVYPLPNSEESRTSGVALGDVDNDGDLDVLVSNLESSHLWINQGGIQGDNFGQFERGQTLGITGGADVVLADLDNDLDLDAVVLINLNQAVQVWENDKGIFRPGATLPFEPGTFASDLAVGMIDADVLPDLYIAIPTGDDLIGINNGFNSFNPDQSLPVGSSQDVALSDIDRDGDLDAVVAVWDYTGNGDQVWLNNQGIFSQAQIFPESRSLALAMGDVDGDTMPDVLLANLEGFKSLWINRLSGAAPREGLSITVWGQDQIIDTSSSTDNEATYHVTITNHSDRITTGIVLDIEIKAEFDEAFIPERGFCGETFPCAIGSLNPGASRTISIVGQVTPQDNEYLTPFQIMVTVSGNEPDPNLTDNTDQMKVYINQCNRADCTLSRLHCQASAPDVRGHYRHLTDFLLDMPMYYQVRDEILASSAIGQHYSTLYYDHDTELQSLILTDPVLFGQAIATLTLWQPYLEALLAGEGDTVTITPAQLSALSGFLTTISTVASPELQQVIAEERVALGPLNEYVGLTMKAAQSKVLANEVESIYLPLLIR
ncbi:MAG: FG-GAP-like repeat-containing protein [Chloroflexota bacterium]